MNGANCCYLVVILNRIKFVYFQVTSSPSKSPSGGVGSPRGVSKTTVLAVSVVAIVSVVYAGCSQQPNIHIIIFIPHSISLRKCTCSFYTVLTKILNLLVSSKDAYCDWKCTNKSRFGLHLNSVKIVDCFSFFTAPYV